MAATAAIGSCFTPANNTYMRSKHSTSLDSTARFNFIRNSKVPSVSIYSTVETIFAKPISRKWWSSRASSSVTQEEMASVETEPENEPEEVTEEAVAEEDVSAPVNTKLYIGNLPYNCDSAQLAGIIQDYGSPEMVEVLYDRGTGRSRGFAFVTMSSVEDANAVIENLDKSEYGGRTLRVNFSDKPKPKEPLYPESEFKLFVGNLSWSVTSENLTDIFQEYGNVVGVRVLYDGETGRSRGYGFVCYSSQAEMETALEALNGVELQGRAMRVNVAEGRRS